MKNSIFGFLMLISALVCGGGIDSGSKVQTIVGLVMFLIFVGGILIEEMYEDVKNYNKRGHSSNVHDYPCFFTK